MRVGIDIDDVLYPWSEQRPRLLDVVGRRLKVELYQADPYPDARGELGRLRRASHTIHLVTARGQEGGPHSEQIMDLTEAWLIEHRIPYDWLHFAHDKAEIPTDMFLDDQPRNYRSLDAAGVDVWLLDRPWNRRLTTARRVPTLSAFVRAVLRPVGVTT